MLNTAITGTAMFAMRLSCEGGSGGRSESVRGGTLEAGPRRAGGWQVLATLRDCRAPAGV